MSRHQWRVTWQRTVQCSNDEDYLLVKHKLFYTGAAARRWMAVLGPEPWLAFKHGPDDPACRCEENSTLGDWDEPPNIPHCDRCGFTRREWMKHKRQDIPPIDWIKIERRTLGPWEPETP